MAGFVIVSFGRGHTIVCEEKFLEEGVTNYRIPKACTVRNWGTKHGLGEIATHGPTSGTVLDAIPFPCRIPADAVHIVYECSEKSIAPWEKAIKAAEKELLVG